MSISYYLGANSYEGFYSLYDEFLFSDAIKRLYIIKGGAGCGKSSFMRKIAGNAEENGLKTELIICSGDTDSLDGVFIPELKLAYVDGTAPHAAVPYLVKLTLEEPRLIIYNAI